MRQETGRGAAGVILIGVFKLASGLMLAAAGLGVFRLIHRDVGEFLEHLATRLHLDPENRVVHGAVERVGLLDPAHLKAIAAGTFFYSALETAEGVGLLLRKRWGSYLTVLATGLLLLPEGYEIARKPSALRVGVLVINLAILAYLVLRLRREGRDEPSTSSETSGRPG